MDFSIDRSANTVTVQINSPFLGEQASALVDAIREFEGIDLLILDFTNSRYINSSGISSLIEIYKLTRNKKLLVRLAGLTREVRDFFIHARLDELFALEDELEGLSVEEYIERLQDAEDLDRVIEKLVELDDAAIIPLRNAMDSENELIRAGAVLALGKLDDSASVPRLCQMLLQDESSQTRQAVAFSMGYLLDDRSVEPLIQALEDPQTDVAEAAAASLGILGSEEVREQLTTKLFHENPRVRGVAAQALGMISDKRVHSSLQELVKDSDPWVRTCAIQALGWMRCHQAVHTLVAALGDDDMRVREAAAASLGRIKAPESIAPLSTSLADENMWVAYFAAKALGQIGDKASIEPLMSTYHATPYENVKIAILYSLRELCAHEASDIFRDAFESSNEDLRKEAVLGLGRIMHNDLSNILRRALKDTNWTVRYAALEMVILHHLHELHDDLQDCLAHETEDIVRNHIAKALTHLQRRGEQ
ncbi:HEAT repeat domain-containing protein [Desulfurispira natronophila]|uniref:Anti-anti-sigma factor n=1 Tax=Desulfurispira natronophila TaxID=682562 RepID=A0A7W8DGT0_9BACT|nr:HEAT repeat domain-containing protein [Desulfurispira natronophila]MBB5021735.1 anti-anti-sigma factor [Desulfurispira natronophila]